MNCQTAFYCMWEDCRSETHKMQIVSVSRPKLPQLTSDEDVMLHQSRNYCATDVAILALASLSGFKMLASGRMFSDFSSLSYFTQAELQGARLFDNIWRRRALDCRRPGPLATQASA
jgi:hypothetical protein